MSAHRPTYIVTAAVMALLTTACTEHNPRYCDSNADCTSSSYPFCDVNGTFGAAGVHNRCIAAPGDGGVTSCDTSADCMSATAPICSTGSGACLPCTEGSQGDADCTARDPNTPICTGDGRCVACNADTDCPDATPLCGSDNMCMNCTEDAAGDDACMARDATKPLCLGGGCVECKANTDCPLSEPICDGMGNFCRPCGGHPECTSDVCDPDSGQCVPDGSVIYVDRGMGTDSQSCGSQNNPCQSIVGTYGGLAKVGSKTVIRVIGNNNAYQGQVDIDGIDVTIYGDGATINPVSSDVPALMVRNGAKVTIEGLHISRAAGSLGDGVYCRGPNSTLRLYHVKIDNNDGQGIDAADGCNLEVERATIDRNTSGGVLISNTDFSLVNNFIIRNGDVGSSGSLFGGVRISNGGDFTQVLDFNTIADSRANSNAPGAGVSCEVTKSMTASNNIVYLRTGGTAIMSNTNCSWTYSDIQGGPAGTGNIDMDPLFSDAANANFHLKTTSPCRNAADMNATNDIDVDGDVRPEGGRADIGADEVYDN